MNTFRLIRTSAVTNHRLKGHAPDGTAPTHLRILFRFLCVLSVIGIAGATPGAQGQTWEWAQLIGTGNADEANAIAVDGDGNTYVTGSLNDQQSFLLASRRANGSERYTRVNSGSGIVIGHGIALDAAGNVYTTGVFDPDAFWVGAPPLMTNGFEDVLVAKLDNSAVNTLWARSAGGTFNDLGTSIAVDESGNSYVTGRFSGSATFGPFTLTSAGAIDVFVAKYDSAGNVVWARSAGGANFDRSNGIAVDGSGNCYVTGFFQDTAMFGTIQLTVTTSGPDVFVAKYDSAGNVVWAKSAGGIGNDLGIGIAVDAFGNSYVTGRFASSITFGTTTLNGAGQFQAFVAKYDSAGNVVWAQSAGGTLHDSRVEGNGIAVDASGNSYMTGSFNFSATFGSVTLNSAGLEDVFVAKYGCAGNLVWARSAGGMSNDRGRGIAVDGFGNIYMTGEFANIATFGATTLASAGDFDVFVAKLSDVPGAGTCGPDADNDGIQDILDDDECLASNTWSDNDTSPVPFGGSIVRLGSVMAVCDLPSPNGVEIEILAGTAARARSFCPTESLAVRDFGVGERIQFDCLITGRALRSTPIAVATAVVGDVDVDLISQSVTIASLTLPEGNAVQFTQETLEVSAPATNTVPLTIENGPRLDELAPGESTTIADFVSVPAASNWGLLILALALLIGVTFKFARRRAVRA